jgi:hypothetical protein
VGLEPLEDGDGCQEERQQAQVHAAFDIVLDAPIDVLSVGKRQRGSPTPGEEIQVSVMGRIAEKVRDAKGDQPPPGIGPPQHLLKARRRRTTAKAGGGDLDQRHKLHRPQPQAEHEHQRQPNQGPSGTDEPTEQPTGQSLLADLPIC